MPRIRSIKPEIFASPQVMNLSRDSRLLFIGLITQADDDGRGVADPRKLKAAIFGGDDDITSARVLKLAGRNRKSSPVHNLRRQRSRRLYSLPTFREHQYVSHPRDSRYPAPPSRNGTGETQEAHHNVPVGSDLKDRKDLKGSGTRARAVNHDPVDNSGGRAPASDDLKKTPAENRKALRELSATLAARAKA